MKYWTLDEAHGQQIWIRIYDSNSNADDPLFDQVDIPVYLGSYGDINIHGFKGYATITIDFK